MALSRKSGGDASKTFLESLLNDLKNLSIETRKKFPQIKEACEEGIIKLRNATSTPQTPIYYTVNQVLYPIIQGCETKDQRIVKMCLSTIQRLIMHQAVDQKGARCITDTLWTLMESGTEEVKILQSVTLLLTTNSVVHSDVLAKNLVLCFRLHFTKDSTTINTAGATVRQLVFLVFERVVAEDKASESISDDVSLPEVNLEALKVPSNIPPKSLRPCAADAYLMFQDLILLVNADQPYWLVGMTEMTRTFGLELVESVLSNFSSVFFKHPEFRFLLKERVCALIIKLFSPNIKYRNFAPTSMQQTNLLDKPYFPISVRLLRIVTVLIQKYHNLLVTECEIFLSLIVKFLDPDKPVWQRCLALEAIHKLVIQPELLSSFCECYDLKSHTTNILQDIVNALGAYVQSLFINPQTISITSNTNNIQGQPPAMLAGMPVGPGVSPQPGFFSKSVWLPIVVTFPSGQAKSTYLEMMDKVEPPSIPDGYGISVAYACLLDIIRSISLAIHGPTPVSDGEPVNIKYQCSEKERALHYQLLESSWGGILAALAPLVDASTDEAATENILKAIQTFVSLCGLLNLLIPRDAFITAICKASLPPHYSLSVLNSVPVGSTGSLHGLYQDSNSQFNSSMYGNELEYKQQVVVVGTPLPTSSLPAGAHQGPVMLTAKNLQCMRALLTLAHCHGSVLGSAWHLVLITLQHLAWILGLKPSTGGSLKIGRTFTDANTVITTAVMADLPILNNMLSQLFQSSSCLDEVSLHHLIDALCKLSHEAMELAYSNREPSLFAVAKLLETGLVNLSRVEVFWRPLTNHLLEVCQHPHIRMREWGVEAVTYLVKGALPYKYQPPLKDNQKLQTLLLSPLAELSSIAHADVRQRQLECVLQVLHSSGETLSHGWPLVLSIIGAVSSQQGENLVRTAFQCLQLVVTDFLPLMPWRCLPLCLETTSIFGSQTQELNISLTAIGLMWNISDYFFQNQEKLSQSLSNDPPVFPDFPGCQDMPPFDKLWMCLFTRLGKLCVDPRPAVRKSAGQTLFSTIYAHGALLNHATWHSVLWQVLFPLLDQVRNLSNSASSEKVDTGGNILIHHSRNTAQKQWAETQVLTLSGVAKVFNTKMNVLESLGGFSRAWSLLLEFVENAAVSKNNEVSLAALRSLQEILYLNNSDVTDEKCESNNLMWDVAWTIWLSIAVQTLSDPEYLPTQQFLAALIQIFPGIFQQIHSRFSSSDLEKLCDILEKAVTTHTFNDVSPFSIPPSETALSQLQEGVLNVMQLLQKEVLSSPSNMEKMICPVFKQLLSLTKYVFQPIKAEKQEGKPLNQSDPASISCATFGEKAIAMVVNLYEQTAHEKPVINGQILMMIIQVFHAPLQRRYDRSYICVWKLAVSSLLQVLATGIPLARKHYSEFESMWSELATALNILLFPESGHPSELTSDEIIEDEAVDCQIIDLLKDEVLSHSVSIPREFILKVVIILNKGSILSAQPIPSLSGSGAESNLREEFAKMCFETLLQFSLLDGLNGEGLEGLKGLQDENGLAGRLAVTALLFRFQEVLKQYVQDESRSGKCPLSRYRLSEISFVLKAITTLIVSLKKTPEKVNRSVWDQLISLYPFLVDCMGTSSAQVSDSLRNALLQYHDLLQPPLSSLSNGK
nr:PREDICTED: protein MON2 homolog isoform X1 [Bemisia tabaci]